MRSLFIVAALAAVALATETEAEQYNRTPSWLRNGGNGRKTNGSNGGLNGQSKSSYRPQTQTKTPQQQRRYGSRPSPKPTPGPTPDPDNHSHGDSILHLKPWEQCQTGILGTQHQFNKVEAGCKAITPSINGFAVTFASLMTNIENVLEPQAETNGTDIGNLQDTNSAQDTQLTNIATTTDELKADVSGATYQILEIEYYLNNLPDITDLEARIMAMEVKQMELMMDVQENDDALEGFDMTLNQEPDPLIPRITELEMTANSLDAQINGDPDDPMDDGLAGAALATMTVAMDQAIAITTLELEWEKQRIVEDYFTVYNTGNGSTPIMLGASAVAFQLPNSCFTIEGEAQAPGAPDVSAHFEFFLSATFNPGPGSMSMRSQVWQVALVQDGNIVAKANYDENTDDGLSRNFALFYKAEVAAGTMADFEIQLWTSDAGLVDIVVLENSIQWGYRVYTDKYPLTAIPPTC